MMNPDTTDPKGELIGWRLANNDLRIDRIQNVPMGYTFSGRWLAGVLREFRLGQTKIRAHKMTDNIDDDADADEFFNLIPDSVPDHIQNHVDEMWRKYLHEGDGETILELRARIETYLQEQYGPETAIEEFEDDGWGKLSIRFNWEPIKKEEGKESGN